MAIAGGGGWTVKKVKGGSVKRKRGREEEIKIYPSVNPETDRTSGDSADSGVTRWLTQS